MRPSCLAPGDRGGKCIGQLDLPCERALGRKMRHNTPENLNQTIDDETFIGLEMFKKVYCMDVREEKEAKG